MTPQELPNEGFQLTRRALLGSALAGGAVFLSGCGEAESQTLTPPPGEAPPDPNQPQFPAPFVRLFEEDELNSQILTALGSAGICSEVGETLMAVQEANALGGDAGAVFTAFSRLGERMASEAAGRSDETAHARYLRASKYYSQALFMVLGSSTPAAEASTFQIMNEAWTAAANLADPSWEKIVIPYGGSTLPGWFFKPAGPAVARPTIIMTNGSDGQNADILPYGPLEAVKRGYNAVLYDGPGQGETLFLRNIPFRPDWEKVVTPVVDYLLTRPEVDPQRIALTGWSMGGNLVARAAAFENRLAAVVSDGGVYSPWLAFPEELREIAEAGDAATVNDIWVNQVIPTLTSGQSFTLAKRLSIFSAEAQAEARSGQVPTDFYSLATLIKSFDIRPVLSQITRPYLVIDYEAEAFYTGQAQTVYEALSGPKDFHLFTGAARYHCAPLAPSYRNEVVFDWLDETLGV